MHGSGLVRRAFSRGSPVSYLILFVVQKRLKTTILENRILNKEIVALINSY